MTGMDRIISVPGNNHVLKRLRELLAAGQSIAFVGAGASAGLYPLWGGLLAHLADEAMNRGLASEADRAQWLRIAAVSPQQAVRGIKERLGRQTYGDVLRRIFGYRIGDDGNPFTPTHQLLLELPFRGYATTNYDPGLLEARRVARPEVAATGYATWQDSDQVRRWLTGEVFQEHGCPILYAHGVFERSDTIVLGAGEYREAYREGLFQRLVAKLWSQEHLVFVGFGFSDSWFGVIAEQVLNLTAHQAAGEPRHIAIVGLPEGEEYSPALRDMFRDAYDAEVLIYPVAVGDPLTIPQEDHHLLGALLAGVHRPASASPVARRSAADSGAGSEAPQRWVHETTEDDRYTEPADALARLDRWAADPRVRTIAVTGIGGLGKTALVGHWLKQRHAALGRPVQGLLGWSFNADRQVKRFFQALVEFASNTLAVTAPQRSTRPVDAAISALRAAPIVVVLDGLEVLQEPPGELLPEGPGRLAHGQFLDEELRAFLDAACRLPHAGLVVLTSRFPFSDLTGFLGTRLRLLELERLSPNEGAQLLARLEVGGSNADRDTASRSLDGHPLALRVFAATLARQTYGDPTRLLHAALPKTDSSKEVGLEAKLRQLLHFYEDQLPVPWRVLLGMLALFPDQVAFDTLLGASRSVNGIAHWLLSLSKVQIRGAIAALAADGLLTRDYDEAGREYYACHQVIRSHFRGVLFVGLGLDPNDVIGWLIGKASGQVRTIAELAVVTNGIARLLDAGEVRQADKLYSERLDNGYVFRWLPAAKEGVQCALGFVADQRRRAWVRDQLSESHLAFYLNEVGVNARNAAELELAERFYHDAAELGVSASSDQNRAIDLQNRAELLVDLGRLPDAEAVAREAADLATRSNSEVEQCFSLARLACVLGLRGQLTESLVAFGNARKLERRINPNATELRGLRGVWFAELLFQLGRGTEARRITEANLSACQRRGLLDDVARCHRLLGHLDAVDGFHDTAASHFASAGTVLRDGHLLPDLTQLLIAQADLDRRRQAWDDCERRVGEAISIAASRRMSLHHADALVLRGRLQLDHGLVETRDGSDDQRLWAEQAADDADAGRTLAQRCDYPWAERYAALLRADAYHALKDAERAHRARREADLLNQRLRLLT